MYGGMYEIVDDVSGSGMSHLQNDGLSDANRFVILPAGRFYHKQNTSFNVKICVVLRREDLVTYFCGKIKLQPMMFS